MPSDRGLQLGKKVPDDLQNLKYFLSMIKLFIMFLYSIQNIPQKCLIFVISKSSKVLTTRWLVMSASFSRMELVNLIFIPSIIIDRSG